MENAFSIKVKNLVTVARIIPLSRDWLENKMVGELLPCPLRGLHSCDVLMMQLITGEILEEKIGEDDGRKESNTTRESEAKQGKKESVSQTRDPMLKRK